MSTQPTSDPQRLAEQLDEVTRREAWLRVKVAQDFLALETQVKAQRQKVQALSDELGARNTYVHELHLEREERIRKAQVVEADLAAFTEMLRAAEDERETLRRELGGLRIAWGWKLCRPLRALQRKFAAPRPPTPSGIADLPGGDFLYYLYTSPFRVHRGDRFVLRGWLMPRDGREVTGVRVRLGENGAAIPARVGIEEPEVIKQHGLQPKNPRPGFEVEIPTASGRHQLRLEAQLEKRDWYSVLSTPIWGRRE